jgi:hypothetical protein
MSQPPLELSYGRFDKGAPGTVADGRWAGLTTVASGSATVDVAAAVVNSDTLILYSVSLVASFSLPQQLCVKSIAPGTGFTLGWANNTAIAKDVGVAWRLWRTS